MAGMEIGKQVEEIHRVLGKSSASYTFVSLDALRPSFPVLMQPKREESDFVTLSVGVPIGELLAADGIDTAQLRTAAQMARYLFLHNFADEIGMVKLGGQIDYWCLLELLRIDGDAVLCYRENFTFVCARDYDVFNHEVELTLPRGLEG